MTNSKNLSIGLGVTAAVAIILAIFLFVSNGRLNNSLDNEKLNAENLLSEKLALQKGAEKSEKEIAMLNESLVATKTTLSQTEAKLLEKENMARKLNAENGNLKKVTKEIEELKKGKTALESKVSLIEKELESQKTRNNELSQNVAAMEIENKALKAEIENLNNYRADNYVASAFKGKADKLTLKAKCTKKITLNFEIPVLLTEAIEFKVFTPSGKEIFKNSKELTWKFIDDSRTLTASLTPAMGSIVETRKVELVYKPVSKLEAGTYKIELYSNSNYLGSCSVRLK